MKIIEIITNNQTVKDLLEILKEMRSELRQIEINYERTSFSNNTNNFEFNKDIFLYKTKWLHNYF